MIGERIRRCIRRWVCPDCDHQRVLPEARRLDRAEQLHAISSLAVAREAEKQGNRVSDMRVAANSAVKRLMHDRHQIEERNGQ